MKTGPKPKDPSGEPLSAFTGVRLLESEMEKACRIARAENLSLMALLRGYVRAGLETGKPAENAV